MITVEKIHEIIKTNCPQVDIRKITADSRLREYGIDSLDFFSIILELQQALGKEIPDEDIDQLRTVASIQEYFKKNSC
jgi:acyl carrier protein